MIENAILAAAMKVFPRRGFAATRVEDILEEAGIARRTFYRYFTSKEDVLAAVYELATNVLLHALEEASAASDPRSCIEIYVDYHVENAGLLRVLVEESVRSDSPLAALRRRFGRRCGRFLCELLPREGVTPLDGFVYVALVSALEGSRSVCRKAESCSKGRPVPMRSGGRNRWSSRSWIGASASPDRRTHRLSRSRRKDPEAHG